MRIAIEMLDLLPGRTRGMETYVRNLVPHLAALAPEHQFLLVVGSSGRPAFAGSTLDTLVPDIGAPRLVQRNRFVLSVWQWFALRKVLRRWRHDVFHSTM